MKFIKNLIILSVVILTGCASSGGSGGGDRVSNTNSGSNRDVWDHIRKGFKMPDLKDSKVQYWVNYYQQRPDQIAVMANRSRKYIYHVTKELESRKMPTELALLPFIESGYKSTAVSRSKAVGLWQFMPLTGKDYNLNQDWWKDERRDPVASTRAALDYFTYLYEFQDKDWHLALASYNWGQNAVKRARDVNAYAGINTDFLSLKMPDETRNYVPKLLAIKYIIANPSKYGITLPHIPDAPYFEEFHKTKDIDMALAASFAGMSLQEFKELNPSFNRPVLLSQHSPCILLPTNRVAQFKKNLRDHKGELTNWQGYSPMPGESLAAISDRFGISLQKLKSLNGYTAKQHFALSSRTLLLPKTGSSPVMPQARDVEAPPAINNVPAYAPATLLASNQNISTTRPQATGIRQVIRQQATTTIAPTYKESPPRMTNDPLSAYLAVNTSQDRVSAQSTSIIDATPTVRAVSYQSNSLDVGVKPAVLTARGSLRATRPTMHRVMPGETLYSLAKRYATSVDTLKALNNIGAQGLRAGLHLHLPGSGVQG